MLREHRTRNRQARFKISAREVQKIDAHKEDDSYSELFHINSAIVRLLLVNGKLLEVVQRYLVQRFLVCGVEEDLGYNLVAFLAASVKCLLPAGHTETPFATSFKSNLAEVVATLG